jgi:hypothetical protein
MSGIKTFTPEVPQEPKQEALVENSAPRNIETRSIEEIASNQTTPTFTAQDLESVEKNTIQDKAGFYGVPGQINEIAEILFEKSNGVIGNGYGSKKN